LKLYEAGTKLDTLSFTVDAALLRELGERLIGQPHIALSELVKNSYDADATTCKIIFTPESIEIRDDGKGMSFREFRDFWMRIGTTHKVDQQFSSRLERPLTGSKGVGRLAVQFLADEMTIETTSEDDSEKMLVAVVDWTTAVRGKSLSTVEVEYEIRKNQPEYPYNSQWGTRIVLSRLKDKWDREHLEKLGADLWALRSPFRRRTRTPGNRNREDFEVEIEAPNIADAREAFDSTIKRLFDNWRARIRGTLDKGRSGGNAVITVEFASDAKDDKPEVFRERVTPPVDPYEDASEVETEKSESKKNTCITDRVSFEILIFKIEGRQVGGVHVRELREYLERYGNVSIYDAGFRLPYYGADHDWLDIALDQSRRISKSKLLPSHLRIDERYMLDLPAPGRIYGAVEINTGHEFAAARSAKAAPGSWLQIQPGRDRLHDNDAFKQLRNLVRFSLDFYANRYRAREARIAEKQRSRERATTKQERALRVLDRNRSAMPAPVYREVKQEVREALKASKSEERALDQRAALLAPLASTGMIALALNHELAREIRFLDKGASDLRRLAKKHGILELETVAREFEDSRVRLDSIRELFAPLLSEEDQSPSNRLRVREVVEQTVGAMRALMPGVAFQFTGIPSNVRFPIGSLAEWNALLQNILANAWNAMLDSKVARVRLSAGTSARKREWLRISDTGQGISIPLEESDVLFNPFERRLKISADNKSIAIGGQGLGLAIVRMIAERRGAEVAFVEPEPSYSTTFELSWKG
jgi:signal transduction histidine kinase